MKLGIMQPYLFPYLGYFQLIAAVDKYVFYDDVTFIKQGWINRNAVLVAGKRHMFTVPLEDASSFTLIRDTLVDEHQYPQWRRKFLKTVAQNYKGAPCFEAAYAIVEGVLGPSEPGISRLATASVLAVAAYLQLPTTFVRSSAIYGNAELKGADRLLDICRQEKADTYYNAKGGRELYSKEAFAQRGVELRFLEAKEVRYAQFQEEFVPWLSIIDVMMFNSKETIQGFLKEYVVA